MRTSHELEGHGNSVLIVGHFCGVVISWVGELSGDGLEESWSRRGQQKCVSSSVVPDSLGVVSSSQLISAPIGCSAPASVCIRRLAPLLTSRGIIYFSSSCLVSQFSMISSRIVASALRAQAPALQAVKARPAARIFQQTRGFKNSSKLREPIPVCPHARSRILPIQC